MTEATRKVHGKSPGNRFALARPLCQRGLKGEIRSHSIVIEHQSAVIPAQAGTQLARRNYWIPAFAGMTMLFHDAFPRIMTRESAHR